MRKLSADPSFQPFRNYALNPDPVDLAYWSTNVGPDVATTSFDSATARIPGRGSFKCTSINGVQFNAQLWDGTTTPLTPVVPGQMVRHAVWVKTSGANINIYPSVRWRASDMSNPATTQLAAVVVGQTWTRVIFQGAAPTGAAWAHLSWAVNALAVGQFAWFVEAVSVVDMPLPDVAPNGTTPGWKWAGTAARSTPIGYPYTLESIAGKPSAALYAPGTVDLGKPAGLGDMSIYLVADRLQVTATWSDSSGLAANGPNVSRPTNFVISQNGGANNGYQARVDTATSGAGYNQTLTGATSVGRHVYSARTLSGITSLKVDHDGAVQSTRGLTANSGIERGPFTMQAASTTFAPVALLLYQTEHSDDIMKRITAWLARSYGSPIPAGY